MWQPSGYDRAFSLALMNKIRTIEKVSGDMEMKRRAKETESLTKTVVRDDDAFLRRELRIPEDGDAGQNIGETRPRHAPNGRIVLGDVLWPARSRTLVRVSVYSYMLPTSTFSSSVAVGGRSRARTGTRVAPASDRCSVTHQSRLPSVSAV